MTGAGEGSKASVTGETQHTRSEHDATERLNQSNLGLRLLRCGISVELYGEGAQLNRSRIADLKGVAAKFGAVVDTPVIDIEPYSEVDILWPMVEEWLGTTGIDGEPQPDDSLVRFCDFIRETTQKVADGSIGINDPKLSVLHRVLIDIYNTIGHKIAMRYQIG